MPELPEVETTRKGIQPHIINKPVTEVTIRDSRLRWPVPSNLSELLHDKELFAVNRRAKYLLLEFEHGTLVIHLGMSGSLRIVSPDTPLQKHDHVDIAFGDKRTTDAVLRYNDPRRFGAVLWFDDINTATQLQKLGPEPLSNKFSGYYLHKQGQKRHIPIKQLIMDNQVVVGVGNIYANEALFMSGIRPTLPANKIGQVRYKRLTDNIKTVLTKAIQQGGTTLKDFVGGDGKPGYFQQQLLVYGRTGLPCFQCGHPLEELKIQGRNTVYCPKCQKGR